MSPDSRDKSSTGASCRALRAAKSPSLCDLVIPTAQGCFLKDQSIPTAQPTPKKMWCEQDDECVLAFNSFYPDLPQLCSESTYCTQKTFSLSSANYLCDAEVNDYTVATYTGLASSCNVEENTENCFVEEHIYFPATVEPGKVVCQYEQGANCFAFFNPNNGGSSVVQKTYHGPFCKITPGCEVEVYVSDYKITKVENCVSLPDDEPPVLRQAKYASCQDNEYCSPYPQGTNLSSIFCVSNTNDAEENVFVRNSANETFYCFDVDTQDFGDYWCPTNYAYDKVKLYCERDTAICDRGFEGYLEHGCDTPLNPQNDTTGNYQSNCVFNQSTPAGLYDSFCCLDAVFNGYQLWQQRADEDHVKVY